MNHGPRTLKLGKWCPGADSNHRHADFQSAALPTELPGLRQAYIARTAAAKPAAGNGIAARPLRVQREKQGRGVTGRVRYPPRNGPSPRQAIRRLCRRPIPPPEWHSFPETSGQDRYPRIAANRTDAGCGHLSRHVPPPARRRSGRSGCQPVKSSRGLSQGGGHGPRRNNRRHRPVKQC